MVAFPTSVEGIFDGIQSFLGGIVNAGWDMVSSALGPLGTLSQIGLVLVVGGLILAGIMGYRQGHEGRVGQAVALTSFGGGLLIIVDYLPPKVLKAIIAFVVIGGMVSTYNLQSYLRGNTESSDWYNFYWRFFGSLTLAGILLVLTLKYIVGIDLPILP